MKKSALFLDRDGIINVDRAYVYRFSDIEWVEGIFDLIRFAKSRGLMVIVLTNQSGVAQGMYKEEDVLNLHLQMDAYLRSQNVFVDDWFYCTEYDSEYRKPRPGMMIAAMNKYGIDLESSFMVGDKPTDVLEIEGPTTFLLKGNYPLESIIQNKKAKVFSSIAEIQTEIQKILDK